MFWLLCDKIILIFSNIFAKLFSCVFVTASCFFSLHNQLIEFLIFKCRVKKVVLPPTSASVLVGTDADEMKAFVKKSGAAVAFGTDPNALVASIADNSVLISKVKGNKGELNLSEGTRKV
jgi:hypothetical protein